MDMTVAIYQISEKFPRTETYRLVAQITRSASSVPVNIAEGNARPSRRDYAHFIGVAKGSLMETETFLMLSTRPGYTTQAEAHPTLDLITEISKMLTVLRLRLVEGLD